MIIKGIVTSKEMKVTKANVPYACFEVEKKKFNCFDAEAISQINVGDNVEIETEKKGLYENIKTIKKVAVEAPNAQIDLQPLVDAIMCLVDAINLNKGENGDKEKQK